MKKLLLILFALMFSLPCEASLSHNTHLTHTGLKPVPNSFQVAKSHFLPEYQTGAMDFVDNSNSTDYCSVSFYKYTAADCSAPKVTANRCPGSDRYSQCNCPGTYVSEEDCTAQGKVTDGTVCNGDNGTKYPACKCPDNYGEVTADKNCSVSICRHQGVSYCPPSALSCKNSFKLCGSGMIAASGASACTDNQGTKYSACSCDTSVYGKTDDICKREFGKNATASGTSCNDERGSYGTSCSCTPDSLSSEYSKSCGSQGYSETIDDGCGTVYYKCNPAANTDAPDYNSLCGTNSGGSISACKKFIKDTWNWRNLEDDMSDLISRLPLNSKGKCDVWQGWCWQRVQGENDTALTYYVVFSDKTINASQTSVGMGYGNLVGLDGFVAYYNIGNSVHKANFIKNCCGLNPKPTVTFSNVTYYGLQKFSYIKSLNLKFTSPATIKAEEVRGVNLTNVTVDNAKIECSSKITGSNKNAFKNVTATGGISGCQ